MTRFGTRNRDAANSRAPWARSSDILVSSSWMRGRVRRREFIALVGGAIACPMRVRAQQQAGKVPRIGFLSLTSPSDRPPLLDAFRQGLRELGWVEGQNIVIDYRYAEDRVDQIGRASCRGGVER